MKYTELWKTVEQEFDAETAILAVAASAIYSSMKVKDTDMESPDKFTKRRNARIRSALWQHSDKVDLVIDIIDAYQDFDTAESFQGLGGCVLKPFREYMPSSDIDNDTSVGVTS